MTAFDTSTSATELATFVASLSPDDIPDRGLRLAERAFVDTVGVTLAGAEADVTAAVLASIGSADGKSTVIGRDETTGLLEAIFVNGTAGHALDFDDVALSAMDGHPSVSMVAPLLTVGERENVSGRDLLTAFVAGFETQCFVSRPISPGHYEGGWHATSTIGVFGATAAVASILELTAEETARALSIAASMPAGLKRNFGTDTKPIHAGQAGRSGTTAALLAAEGTTAELGAIDGKRGFFECYRGDGEVNRDRIPTLGEQWSILVVGIDVKKYPCCYYTHAAIAATIELCHSWNLTAADVDEVTVTVSQGAADALHYDDPQTSLEAKFSMSYLIARAIVDRAIDLSTFEGSAIDELAVQSLCERVTMVVDDDVAYDSNAATVDVTTHAGKTNTQYREQPPGTHENPLSTDELEEKFRMCAAYAPGHVSTTQGFRSLDSLRTVDSVSTLLESL